MKYTFLILSLLISYKVKAQILETEINTTGIVMPRMDSVQRNTLSAVQGQCIYNTDLAFIECFDGTSWKSMVNKPGFSAVFGPSFIVPRGSEVQFNSMFPFFNHTNSFNGQSFTVPESGIYLFHYKVAWRQETADLGDIFVELYLKKNGGQVLNSLVTDWLRLVSSFNVSMEGTVVLMLSVGDQITMAGKADTGSLLNAWANGGEFSTFSGFKID